MTGLFGLGWGLFFRNAGIKYGKHLTGAAIIAAAWVAVSWLNAGAYNRGGDAARLEEVANANQAAIVQALREHAASESVGTRTRDQIRACVSDPNARCVLSVVGVRYEPEDQGRLQAVGMLDRPKVDLEFMSGGKSSRWEWTPVAPSGFERIELFSAN